MKVFICVAYSVFITFSFAGFVFELLSTFGVVNADPNGFAVSYLVNFILVLECFEPWQKILRSK